MIHDHGKQKTPYYYIYKKNEITAIIHDPREIDWLRGLWHLRKPQGNTYHVVYIDNDQKDVPKSSEGPIKKEYLLFVFIDLST